MKERIVGAIALVALMVLVVPVFLDGPPAGGKIRTERVPLPGQDEQKVQTVVLERQRSEPVPAQSAAKPPADDAPADEKPAKETTKSGEAAAQSGAVAPPPVSTSSAERGQSASKPHTGESPDPATANAEPVAAVPAARATAVPATTISTSGMFAVQLGSFSSKENAEKLAAELRRQGFAAFLSQLDSGSRHLHRVRVGPQKDRQAAESMAARLAAAGHKGQVVTHP